MSRNNLLVISRKDLCEARINSEVCSYLADIPTLADGPPANQALISGKPIH